MESIAAPFEIQLTLLREMAILECSDTGFEYIYSKRALYEHDQIQAFHSYRRIFEHYLIRKDIKKAGEIYPLLYKTFIVVKHLLHKVSRYSFYKNLYHYFIMIGDKHRAQRIFRMVVIATKRLNLIGQYRDITDIRRSFE